jgi:hypothetical protein
MWCRKDWYNRRFQHKKAATYNVNFMILYIDLKIINFLRMVARRNFMNARKMQSDTKSVIDGNNVNLHAALLFVVSSCNYYFSNRQNCVVFSLLP